MSFDTNLEKIVTSTMLTTEQKKEAIKSLILSEVIGQDESITRAGNTAQLNSIMGKNYLRESQRKLIGS